MPDATTVRLATAADLARVGQSLASAFADDPIWLHLAPHGPHRWERAAPRFFHRVAEAKVAAGEVWITDEGTAAAVWARPGRWRSELRDALRMARPSIALFRVGGMVKAVRTMQEVERRHPRSATHAEHWYLEVLGTHADHQGKGHGSAVLGPVLARCDAEGVPAYLESSKEENLPFYARHGFEAGEPFRAAGSPPMWPMWREPR